MADRRRYHGAGRVGIWCSCGRGFAPYGAAIAADVLQLVLGLFGLAFADEIIDVVAMVILSTLVGIHPGNDSSI